MVDPKEQTKLAIVESRARIATIAEELARRASPDYVKEQAKEVVIDQTRKAMRPLGSPWVIGLAATAAGVAIFLRFGGAPGRAARATIMRTADKILSNRALQKSAQIALRGAQLAAPVAKISKMLPATARVAAKTANEAKRAYDTVEEGQRTFKRKHWVSSAIAALVTMGAVAAAVRAQYPSPKNS